VFRARRDEPRWPGRLLLPALFVTLTFLAKASALIYVPVSLALIELERLWRGGWRPTRSLAEWRPALYSLRDQAAIGLMGVVLLFVVCPRAGRALAFQIHHNRVWNGAVFLLEDISGTGYWYYFLAALTIKLGLPILILFAVTLLLRPRLALNGPMCATLGLLTLTLTFHVQMGVRYVLPIAALAIVGASAAFVCGRNEQGGMRRTLAGGFAVTLVFWSLTNACLVWPNGICFTNELFGGTREGYRALGDSNYDWGQGVPELADWQRRHADAPLNLWYFGTDPRATQAPFHPVAPADLKSGEGVRRLCQGGYLAASTSLLHGYFFDTPAAQYLRKLQPCGRTTTYLIYDFK
jgi:hypothetical protein